MFDQGDAQLDLSAGQPRFYIMRLPRRGRRFERITYHARVTQCLGVLQPASPWFMVVAAPTLSVERYPQQANLAAFRIPHGVFVKLHKGTWHAGPLFDGGGPVDFYNLELSDTNVTDHNTHDYGRAEGLAFEVSD
ncbi:ureidoglycolate hydrolase [Micractinium conductrix]|uniref:Ureidoglycolate hydrolase n=1 Tax=Micractinium conductrix TaxID=554055 RepID=A0A2P6VLB8_9CHLO|nr:ureidoglycolate hydrolase [Micractinium conductrix]|eukprot:PSC74878.1 ureidoglycolate hydrolase [Micractinium conductrix]